MPVKHLEQHLGHSKHQNVKSHLINPYGGQAIFRVEIMGCDKGNFLFLKKHPNWTTLALLDTIGSLLFNTVVKANHALNKALLFIYFMFSSIFVFASKPSISCFLKLTLCMYKCLQLIFQSTSHHPSPILERKSTFSSG